MINPTTGGISYDGFTFPLSIKTKLRSEPVSSSAGRSVKYRKYQLTVETIVTSEDLDLFPTAEVEAKVQALRRKLTSYGKELIIYKQGYGAFARDAGIGLYSQYTINSQNDMDFGPKPQVLVLEPVGANRAFRLVWTVDFCVTDCEDHTTEYGDLGDFEFEFTVSCDRYGNAVRRIMGMAELANFRDGRTSYFSPDSYRNTIANIFPLLSGFRRDQDFRTSADRKFLHFHIIDSQIPGDEPYFPGLVDMDVRHRVSAAPPSNALALWDVSFSGNFTLAPGFARSVPWLAFLSIVSTRLSALTSGENEVGEPASIVLIHAVTIEEAIHRREFSFHISYRISCRWQDIIAANDLFVPVNHSTWAAWKESMSEAYQPGGYADPRLSNADDAIIDYCFTGDLGTATTLANAANGTEEMEIFSTPSPGEEASWLQWKNQISIVRDGSSMMHRRLSSSGDGQTQTGFLLSGNNAVMTGPTIPNRNIIQDRGNSSYRLVMQGFAMRIGRHPVAPFAASIDGEAPIVMEESVTPSQVWQYRNGLPIYYMTWRKVYWVENPNAQIKINNIPALFRNE